MARAFCARGERHAWIFQINSTDQSNSSPHPDPLPRGEGAESEPDPGGKRHRLERNSMPDGGVSLAHFSRGPMKLTSRGALLLLLASAPLFGQAPKDVTVAWAYSDEAEAATKMPSFVWTSGGDLLLLDETKSAATRTIERVKAGRARARRPSIGPRRSRA